MDFRTKDKLRSGELHIRGDQWPIFIYAGYTYDGEDPWNGLLRSPLLVCVSHVMLPFDGVDRITQAYKHIFTSPSSVDKEPKATRSGNARIHGMTCTTPGSIAYVATQVYFHHNLMDFHDHNANRYLGPICISVLTSVFAH